MSRYELCIRKVTMHCCVLLCYARLSNLLLGPGSGVSCVQQGRDWHTARGNFLGMSNGVCYHRATSSCTGKGLAYQFPLGNIRIDSHRQSLGG